MSKRKEQGWKLETVRVQELGRTEFKWDQGKKMRKR